MFSSSLSLCISLSLSHSVWEAETCACALDLCACPALNACNWLAAGQAASGTGCSWHYVAPPACTRWHHTLLWIQEHMLPSSMGLYLHEHHAHSMSWLTLGQRSCYFGQSLKHLWVWSVNMTDGAGGGGVCYVKLMGPITMETSLMSCGWPYFDLQVQWGPSMNNIEYFYKQ